LIERALRERWPIPRAIRKPLIERLNEVVQDTDSSPREVVSAAKAILAASKLNLETITATIKAQEHEELVARLGELERRVGGQSGRTP
jgi:DNA polymerase II large subunit